MDGSQEKTEFAQKQRSINGHRDEEDRPSSWDPRRPPLGGTAQVQLGGVYGNYFSEPILIYNEDRCICIGVLKNLMHI